MQITTIGVDLAKHVFQLHGVGPDGRVALRQKLRRSQMMAFFSQLPPCLVAMEACATAHHWGRELAALGHEVRLMPAHYVKAYLNEVRTMQPTQRRSPRQWADQRCAS